jgi:EAL domain-containing protein (putative c-di-GMP-specific phosphodiesterase class I)
MTVKPASSRPVAAAHSIDLANHVRHSGLSAELDRLFLAGAGIQPEDHGFELHYQPIVDLSGGGPRGFEALIRWHHPDYGPVSAQDLIDAAEDTGHILPLGDWVLRRALLDASVLGSAGADSRFVSVNVSATQLLTPGFAERTRDLIATVGVDPSRLVLEITESLAIGDTERIWDDFTDLRGDGIQVAIDDYGTGYASLAYLRHPVIDMLKLDRTFLDNITDQRGRTILQSVVTLTRSLGIDLVAEGIEDEATMAQLVELGCTLGQGYLFAPAMPLTEAVRWDQSRDLTRSATHRKRRTSR